MRLPSTKDLRAFETIARLGSIKAAATQMHLTPSTLTRRLQNLETALGKPLFIRDARGMTPTEAGKEYAKQLRKIFQLLDAATDSVCQAERLPLRIAAGPTIMGTIVPNLPAFEQQAPLIELELLDWTGKQPSDLGTFNADLVFAWGNGAWDGWESQNIMPRTHIAPTCTPELLQGRQWLPTEELAEHPWIVVSSFPDGWQRWFDALGAPLPNPRRILKVTHGRMALEASRQGRGLVMGWGFGGWPILSTVFSRMVNAHPFHALTPDLGFYLHRRQNAGNPAIPLFCDWFFDHAWSQAGLCRYLDTLTPHYRNA